VTESTVPKVSKKQQQIVNTAEELFFRFGIKRVTVEEICQKANASKMTFYRYFANKIDLVKYISYAWLEKGEQKLDEVMAMDIPFTEKLRIMLGYRLQVMATMSTEFIEEYMQLDFYAPIQQAWLQRVVQFLIEAQKEGHIRPEVRPEFILRVFNKLNELVEDEYLKSLYPNYVELSREVFNLLYYGILTGDHSETLV
jgi:AcrR family transcriptional regulator